MNVREKAHEMKLVSPRMAATSIDVRNAALERIISSLEENKEKIFDANKSDLSFARENKIAEATLNRLKFGEAKLNDCISGIRSLIGLENPLGKITLNRELDDGLILKRITVPIGVIGVIFEARPDALVQIATLCIKSGNCAVLKGGKETENTNDILFKLIETAACGAGIPEGTLFRVSSHNEIDELLSCYGDVDLLIPRGSNKFVQYIMDNTKIPVMGHSSGICHIYIDSDFDKELAKRVIIDAKTQYPAACNAVETVLINRSIGEDFVRELGDALNDAGVAIRGSKEVLDILGETDEKAVMDDGDFGCEYNDMIISLKYVDDVVQAVAHINKYGSHHTDCIITNSNDIANYFATMVDSAGVYRNVSTRFADGYRYGFGAEVGISTGKLHARGPVGLDGLVTYKYMLSGNGDIVGDYASGKKTFKHRDI